MTANTECKLCKLAIRPEELLYETKFWRIRHSDETDIEGYCILEPKRHFLDLSDATEEELSEYPALLARLMKAQRGIPDCKRVYTFTLAESVSHYHLHAIPRSNQFPQQYVGRGIMSYPLTPALSEKAVESAVAALRTRF